MCSRMSTAFEICLPVRGSTGTDWSSSNRTVTARESITVSLPDSGLYRKGVKETLPRRNPVRVPVNRDTTWPAGNGSSEKKIEGSRRKGPGSLPKGVRRTGRTSWKPSSAVSERISTPAPVTVAPWGITKQRETTGRLGMPSSKPTKPPSQVTSSLPWKLARS